jgi:hypothetical protein
MLTLYIIVACLLGNATVISGFLILSIKLLDTCHYEQLQLCQSPVSSEMN